MTDETTITLRLDLARKSIYTALAVHAEDIQSLVDQEVSKICSAENLAKLISREAERVIDETIKTELRKLYESGDGRQIIMNAVRRKLEL